MAGRHQPTNGADSAASLAEAGIESWNPRPWRVLMCDRYEPEIRFEVRIAAAGGKADARNQARERYPEASALAEWEDAA